MRLLTALVFVLLLSSCQQRYWHVKRVKADKHKSIQKENPYSEKEAETLSVIPSDTLPERLVLSEIHDDETEEKTAIPETKQRHNANKSLRLKDLHELPYFRDLSLHPNNDEPNNEPLTLKEKVLILCTFYIWFSLFFFLALIPAAIVATLLFYSAIFGLAFISPSTIALLLILAGILLLLCFIFSFIVGKNRINKKLGRELAFHDLIGYFLIAVLVAVASNWVPALLISVAILKFLPYIVFIFAAIYVMMW